MKTYTAIILTDPDFTDNQKRLTHEIAMDRVTKIPLEAEDLEDVFVKLNHGSGGELRGYHGRSLSVGDGVKDPEGKLFIVAGCGFTEVQS
jgi:hypothetical protein